MILVDANILLYAEDSLSPQHKKARLWWDAQLSGVEPVALCWPVLSAFVRIATNPRLQRHPLSTTEAAGKVDGWLAQPCVRLITPTATHWSVFRRLLIATKAQANLVSDAHIAALAIEHGATVYSSDEDFRLFPKVPWVNPLR